MDLIISENGRAVYGDNIYRCAIGRNGIRSNKREGDGATPSGCYSLIEIRLRIDRVGSFKSALPVYPILEDSGWCDDPAHPDYNRLVKRPHPARHEALWREDNRYDIVVVTDFNTAPVTPGLGSAIFMHLIGSPDYPPTEGCVALSGPDLQCILARWADGDRLVIAGNS